MVMIKKYALMDIKMDVYILKKQELFYISHPV